MWILIQPAEATEHEECWMAIKTEIVGLGAGTGVVEVVVDIDGLGMEVPIVVRRQY